MRSARIRSSGRRLRGGRAPFLVTALVLALALGMRWPIASHDVEHYIGPDEGEVVENVLQIMKTGDLDHRHPGYPGLHFYLQMLPAAGQVLAASFRGEPASIPELPRASFYLAARRFTLLAGILAAVVVFFTGRSFLTPWGAALSASLVALSPLSFRESAVVNPDLMLSLFVASSLWCCLRLLAKRTWTSFVAAGASVGLAAAIKYTGVFTVFPYAVAWLAGAEPGRHRDKAAAGAAAAGVAFALASPYTLLELPEFFRGMTMHFGYYSAGEMNASLELGRILVSRGLGIVAGLSSFIAAARALAVLDRKLLLIAAYPFAYLMAFSFFDRAFPRHALVLLPPFALLSADAALRWCRWASERFPGAPPWTIGAAFGLAFVLAPFGGSIELALRTHRTTPAERAAAWAEARLPEKSRVLQDQFTPRLDPARFEVHRLGVAERRFVGNYDWVFYSGYPPGLSVRGLREVAQFEPEGALGDAVTVYQVPDRESLMPVTLPRVESSVELGAGETPYFGEGWYPPRPGAYETSRLSRGSASEIFFVLPRGVAPSGLKAELAMGPSVRGGKPRVRVELNGRRVGEIELGAEEWNRYPLELPAEILRPGLNRLVLQYGELARRDRRHPDTAIRLYRIRLEK